jgi:hypothetical protein
MKKCIICDDLKSLDEFYSHSEMSDGHLNKCKSCCKTQAKLRRDALLSDPVWFEKEKERCRKKAIIQYYREKGSIKLKDRKHKGGINYKNNYPEKAKAKTASSSIQVSNGMHRHHWSYKEEHWCDIIPIEPKRHYFIHRFLNYCKMNKCYKTKDGELLDTKEKHLSYLLTLPF